MPDDGNVRLRKARRKSKNLGSAVACQVVGAQGIEHRDKEDKRSVLVALSATKPGRYPLDVTVVDFNNPKKSRFFYTRYTVKFSRSKNKKPKPTPPKPPKPAPRPAPAPAPTGGNCNVRLALVARNLVVRVQYLVLFLSYIIVPYCPHTSGLFLAMLLPRPGFTLTLFYISPKHTPTQTRRHSSLSTTRSPMAAESLFWRRSAKSRF